MKLSLLVICVLVCSLCFAQSNADVEKAVRNYVDGFYYGDTNKIKESISPQVIKHGYYTAKNNPNYTGDTMTFRQCVDYAAGVKKRGVSPKVEEFPKKIEVYDVLDKTASAKLTAWWGTDYILLTKVNDKWMITHVLWQSPAPSKN